MSGAEATNLVVGTLTGILASTAFVLALFLGFCVLFGFPKLRPTVGRRSMVVRSLDEKVGQESFSKYLPPDAPRGPVDVLHAGQMKS